MKPAGTDEFTATAVNGIRTTSSFSQVDTQTSSTTDQSMNATAGMSGAWGSYSSSNGGFADQPSIGDDFSTPGDAPTTRPAHQQQRSVSGTVAVPPGTGELVTISTLPDKEGVFLFQHHNYEVKTIRRASSVVRRYSDFVWLLDCLHKRYPFRRLPLLPPKRIQGMHD